MLGVALKGIPRDSYRLMSKVTTHEGIDPLQKIDELRKLAHTGVLRRDAAAWAARCNVAKRQHPVEDGVLEAQARHAVVGRGASVHGLPALRQVPGTSGSRSR